MTTTAAQIKCADKAYAAAQALFDSVAHTDAATPATLAVLSTLTKLADAARRVLQEATP